MRRGWTGLKGRGGGGGWCWSSRAGHELESPLELRQASSPRVSRSVPLQIVRGPTCTPIMRARRKCGVYFLSFSSLLNPPNPFCLSMLKSGLALRGSSLRTSSILCLWLSWRRELDACAGTVALNEDLAGDAAHIALTDFVNPVQFAEEFAPVAVAGLIFGELVREPFVVGEAAEQASARACLEHLEFLVADVRSFQLVDFFMDRVTHFVGRMS